MLAWIIDVSLKHRVIVLMVSVLLVIAGVIAIVSLPLDAFPDTTPVQVQINTVAAVLRGRDRAADYAACGTGHRRPARARQRSFHVQIWTIPGYRDIPRPNQHLLCPATG